MPTFDFGGSGPLMTFAPANGFPPVTYQPLLHPLTADYSVISMPPRALIEPEPPTELQSWKDTLAADMIATLQARDLRDVIGIGHSFGGIATLLAAIAEPDRFKAVILLDPTILPEPFMIGMRDWQAKGEITGNPLAERASKRRYQFESHAAAYEYFKGKRLFADWPDETVRLYADSFVPDGDGVKLLWPREWETYYFRTLYTYTWDELPALGATGLPILLIRGGESDTFLADSADRFKEIIPATTYHVIDGHGHLFPQSAPAPTRQIITDWLQTL